MKTDRQAQLRSTFYYLLFRLKILFYPVILSGIKTVFLLFKVWILMPFTPYHFGPSGFFALVLRRYLDVPVFVFVNVLIDIEVLADIIFNLQGTPHTVWHFHTLLVGSIVGAVFAFLLYSIKPLRMLLDKVVQATGLPYKPALSKMIFAGVLGACFHVLIDSFCHYDVRIFWPLKGNPLWPLAAGRDWRAYGRIETICIAFWALLVIYYLYIVVKSRRASRKADAK